MARRKLILLADPMVMAPAVAELRRRAGITTRTHARMVAAATGRPVESCYQQMYAWDNGLKRPGSQAVAPALRVLGYGIGFIPLDGRDG